VPVAAEVKKDDRYLPASLALQCTNSGTTVMCTSSTAKPAGWAAWVLLRSDGKTPGRYIKFTDENVYINSSFQAITNPSAHGEGRSIVDGNGAAGSRVSYVLVAIGADQLPIGHSEQTIVNL
jgi:hypothetical protein